MVERRFYMAYVGGSSPSSGTIFMHIKCPNCNTDHYADLKDKVEIYCQLCCYIFSVNSQGIVEKSKYDNKFDLCSSDIHERGGPGMKVGQFVWASR